MTVCTGTRESAWYDVVDCEILNQAEGLGFPACDWLTFPMVHYTCVFCVPAL